MFIPTDACLRTLYVFAFTSGEDDADTSTYHNITLEYSGIVLTMTLYDRPGSEFILNKGDLWNFRLPSCITLHAITAVSVVANGNDGWNIESIVTLVRDTDNRIQLLTNDFDVYRWIDSNDDVDHRKFKLTLSRNDIISGKALIFVGYIRDN